MNALALISCFGVMAGGGGTLLAQSENASIRLLAFNRVGDTREVMVAGPDGKLLHDKPLTLPTEQLSSPLSVAARSLVFQSPGATPSPVGKVELPASGKDFILIFLPGAKDSVPPYKVDAVPVPEGEFGSGDQLFVNYSGSNIGFVIGGEKLAVPMGKSAIYHPKKSEGNRPIAGYHQLKDGKWSATPFYSTRLIVQDGVRNLVLIVRNPKTGDPDFRGVADFVERP